MKLNRRQLIQAIVVVVNHLRLESLRAYREESERKSKEVDAKLKTLPIVKAALKLMELENTPCNVSTDHRHIFIREKSNDWDRSEIKIRIPRDFNNPKPFKYEPLCILGVKIEGDWVANLKRQITIQIDAVEVSSLLADKKFTLNLQEFLTQIGIKADVTKLNLQPEFMKLTTK